MPKWMRRAAQRGMTVGEQAAKRPLASGIWTTGGLLAGGCWSDEMLTRDDNLWEDFTPGDVLIHKRGRTIGDSEHMTWTTRVMNTAEIHFNQQLVDEDPAMQKQSQGKRLVYGGYVLSVCMGLSTPDTTENALAILGLESARHTAGVYAGDTLFARTEVLDKREGPTREAGIVKFKLIGLKQDRQTVCVEAIYEALIKRRT